MEITPISSALTAVNSCPTGSIAQSISIKMLDQSMELNEAMNTQLISLMEQSVTPHLGGNIDLRV